MQANMIHVAAAQVASKHDRARDLIAKGNWPAARMVLRATHQTVIAICEAARNG